MEETTLSELARRCQQECGARCCKYVTVLIPAPKNNRDLDEISWWLAHRHVVVYTEARRWHLEFQTPCRYLTADNLCAAYEDRPVVCREYDPANCEYPHRPKHALEFDSREEFESWRARKQLAAKSRSQASRTRRRTGGEGE